MTRIFLVRHGQTTLNSQGIISGHADPELTALGEEQARTTKQELAHVKFDVVYSSDLRRAANTAEIIYGSKVPESNRWRNLRERQFGSVDNKPEIHLAEEHTIKSDLQPHEAWVYKYVPDMENDQELSSRFVTALEEIASNHKDQTILVVAHGGAIRTTLMKLQDASYRDYPNGSFKNAGYVELEYRGGKLEVINIQGLQQRGSS